MTRALAALVLLLAVACGRGNEPDAAALYASAREALLRGELHTAADLTARGLAVAAGDARDAPALRLLNAEILLVQRDAAAASRLIDTPSPPGPDFARLEARRTYLAGYRHMTAAQFDEALTTLDLAVERGARADAIDVVLDAHILAGQALLRRERWAEGETRLGRARALAKSSGDRAREAAALVTLGMGHLVREQYDAALTWFEQVLAFEDLGGYLSYVTALSNAGTCYARLGEFDRAVSLQQRAIEQLEARNVPAYLEEALGEFGHTQFLRGNPEAAVTLLTRARAVAAAAGRTANAALWTDSSATALIDLQRWTEAERLNEDAIALKRAAGSQSLAPNMINRAQIAAGRGQHADAAAGFTAALADSGAPPWVQWQAHAGLGALYVRTGRTQAALTHFEQALVVVEHTRSALLRPEYRIAFQSRMIHFYREYVDALVRVGRAEQALEVADASRARVLAERFGGLPGARVRADVFVARARRDRTTILAYWLAPARSFVWTIDGRGIHLSELPASSVIDEMVAAHRTFVERTLGDPLRVSQAPGDRLATTLLGPVLPFVPRDSRVVIVPDGTLHGISFETLPVGALRHYWIEDVTITIAPALSLAGAAVAPRAPAAARSLLLIGDPIRPDASLARLQYASAEVDGIRDAFDTPHITVRRGVDASPAAFLGGSPGEFSTIHFAAHATTSALSPLDSAVELSPDGNGVFKLYARDVARQALRADLVTISACRSAGDRAYGGEGLVGLAWAFLRAGATRVIAGLWDVDDQSTASLMTDTYAGLARGLPPAEALREAKLRLIARGGNFAKPYYWAPFQVFAATP